MQNTTATAAGYREPASLPCCRRLLNADQVRAYFNRVGAKAPPCHARCRNHYCCRYRSVCRPPPPPAVTFSAMKLLVIDKIFELDVMTLRATRKSTTYSPRAHNAARYNSLYSSCLEERARESFYATSRVTKYLLFDTSWLAEITGAQATLSIICASASTRGEFDARRTP